MSVIFITSCSDKQATTPDIPFEQIRAGDILLRRGEGVLSKIVVSNDIDGKYSHIGIAVLTDSGIMAVHAVPGEHDHDSDFDRVKIEPIANFFRSDVAERGAILRYPLEKAQQEKINNDAIEMSRAKIKFDHDYNLADTTKLYCTELIQLLYARIGVDLSEARMTKIQFPGMSGEYIMPSDVYKNDKLVTIYKY